MSIKELTKAGVWKYFEILSQIPRPSKKEDKIIEYLVKFAQDRKLEYKKDDMGNVVIKKSATKGFEDLETIILQSHVDMVCEKNSDKLHDFENDPLTLVIDGEWLKADGTTLGADNGIGVAAQLAILDSNEIEHGPLECLFTVDEETGLTGAQKLSKDMIDGSILINLDTEEEGQIYIGCAGGKTTIATFNYQPTPSPKGLFWFHVKVWGLQGGHSGSDIHVGLGNANKILVRFLWKLNREIGLHLSEINGGNLHNAIAREADAIAGVKYSEKEKVAVLLNTLLPQIQEELKKVDPGLNMKIETCEEPKKIIEDKVATNLLNAIYCCPHGMYKMSDDIDDLVETSTNLAAVKMIGNDKIEVKTSQRSSTESQKDNIVNMVTACFLNAGAEVKSSPGYPAWKPNTKSKILDIAKETYKAVTKGEEAKIMAIHAGLECGLFLEKYPHLDMISIGPTIREAHSPDEKVHIESVSNWWKYLLELLKNGPKHD